MLFYRDRIVSTPLHRGIVRYHHALEPVDHADADHDAARRHRVVVNLVAGHGPDFQERCSFVAQSGDPIADEHFLLFTVPGVGLFITALSNHGELPREIIR